MSGRAAVRPDRMLDNGAYGIDRATLLVGGWYLSVAQAADELDVTTRTIYYAIQRGRIVPTHVGSLVLISAGEVYRYRVTRQPGRGRRLAQSKAEKDAALRWVAAGRTRDWKGTAVYYRHHSGQVIRLDVQAARLLQLLASRTQPVAEGVFAARALSGRPAGWRPGRIRRLIERLVQKGLIVRTTGRDPRGGRVPHVHLGHSGRHALDYCRDRGLGTPPAPAPGGDA